MIEQWMLWHQLAMNHPTELIEAMTAVLEDEQIRLPTSQPAMQIWAASLLVETLDRMEMA